MADQQKAIPISSLSLEELNTLKQRTEAEVEQLSASLDALTVAAEKFMDSKDALTVLTPANKGKQILIPLTGSLYVPATLTDVEHVTVNVGAHYYVRQSVRAAGAHFDRRVSTLKGQVDQLTKVLQQKNHLLNVLVDTMRAKVQQQQQQEVKGTS